MVTLPVSGLDVTLRRPAGEEDVLIWESPRRDMALVLDLLATLARTGDAEVRWEALTVTDVEALLLELRRLLFGDLVRGQARCESADCRARVDVTFRISDYLAHHTPRGTRDAEPAGDPGWYALRNAPVSFRLPLAGDQVAIAGRPNAERSLVARCIRPPELPARLLRRVERVMQAMAPSLGDVVEGTCPECGASIAVYFDPQDFTLRELRDQASFVFQEIHLLASRYHWSEERIMRLPGARRAQYAEMIRGEEAGA